MGADIRKFINPRFLRGIDLRLMRELFARHLQAADLPVDFDGEPQQVRAALAEYFDQPIGNWGEGLVADLHRIADLGNGDGMQLLLNEARRRGVSLFPARDPADEDLAPAHHEPRHVALHAYLHHPAVFEVAADYKALQAPTAMAEFRGPDRDVGADLTDERLRAFREAIAAIFEQDLQGNYCRLGPYEEEGEINLVVSHGAPVKTTAVVTEGGEAIITLRAVKYAVLRYSAPEGFLRIAGVPKAQQKEVAGLFAWHILTRPGFFDGLHARDLYTLAPIAEAGPDFAFEHAYDERILEVRIVAAAADLYTQDEEGRWRFQRSWISRDASGGALRHFRHSEVRFDRGWRLGEITLRVLFRGEGKRPTQVTVRLKPPGTLSFRRTRHEKAILELIARNGLETDRDAGLVLDAAE